MPNSLASISFTLAAGSLAACTTTDSDNILTSGMYASITATADGTGSTTVSASLFLGPPSDLVFIELHGGDQLIAHHGGLAKVMSEQRVINIVSHHATFAGDGDAEAFEIEFQRDVDRGAPSSLVALPPKFTLAAIPQSSRAAPMTFSWAPAGGPDRMRWQADGSCIDAASGVITGDPGSVTLPAGTLRKRADQTTADSCQVTVTVRRDLEGDLDLNFGKGGDITGVQTRAQTFTSTP